MSLDSLFTDGKMELSKTPSSAGPTSAPITSKLKKVSVPNELLVGLRDELMRVEPELSRLVQLYDELSMHKSGDPSIEGVGLLDESWCEALGVPSEVDVRAAAVRLFVNDGRIPGWLKSRPYSSTARMSNVPKPSVSVASNPGEGSTAPVSSSPIQKREELLRQYDRAASMCGQLVELCRRLERILDRIENLSARNAAQELVKWETGVGLADVSAAASRLRIFPL
jgi:hypothetical protein